MQDTIFAPSFGNRPHALIGREETMSEMKSCLESRPGTRERAVIILGQRGSGKTVILWELADIARDMGYIVASPTAASENMLGRIVEKLQDGIENDFPTKNSHLSGGSLGILGFSAGIQFEHKETVRKSYAYQITKIARELTAHGKGMLVLIDELQANSSQIREFIVTYQEMVGEGLNVSVIMAGLPGAVSTILNDHVLTFFNRALKLQLPPLRSSDIYAYYRQAFSEIGLKLDDDHITEAANAADGSPYMMQLIGHNIIINTPETGTIDEAGFRTALQMSGKDFMNDVCGTTLAALSEKDIDFITALAAEGQPGKISSIAKRMGVSQDYAQKYKKRLIEAGVIKMHSRGQVEFAVPLMQEYLKKITSM
ncbi:MAG: AAA family ATPase [Eubacteriales bacterium]|nr:AAA family ATPase [Eubacteriales bacterium]